jgi:RNA polymerase subunit RPABC4/transcription elongation factor Spt4
LILSRESISDQREGGVYNDNICKECSINSISDQREERLVVIDPSLSLV